MRKLGGWILVGVLAAACAPEINVTAYQSYTIQLAGPDPKYTSDTANAGRDPFAATANGKYIVTVKYFEDAAGTVPYGKSLSSLPDQLKGFLPVQKFTVAGGQTTFSLGDGNQVLPQVVKGAGIYLSTEVTGYDDTGTAIARARCPVQKLLPADVAGSKAVVCTAFYGFIGKWNPVHGPISPRFSFAASALPDGRVVIGGGKLATTSESASPIGSVEVYDQSAQNEDGSLGAWSSPGNLALMTARYELTASATDDGFVIFAGGKTGTSNFSNALDVFDGENTAMKPTHPLNLARAEHSSAPFNGNSVVVAGGKSGPNAVATGAEMVTPDGSTQPIAASSAPRSYGCLVAVQKNELLFCGGGSNTCETFSGTNFNAAGTMSASRDDVMCAAVDGNAYLIGGIADSTDPHVGDIEEWSNGTINVYAQSPFAALTHHAIAVANGKVVVAGGYQAGNTAPLQTGFWFDPATSGDVHEIKGPFTEMMVGRADFQMIGLPDGTVMAIGGKTSAANGPGAEIFVVPDSAP